MFNFYESLKEYLEENLSLHAPIALGGLTSANESIALVSMPSPSDQLFYDRKRPRIIQFQILTKSVKHKTAMNKLEEIASLLDGGFFVVEGYVFDGCEVYSEPSYLETTEKKEFIYTAAFRAELTKE